MRALLFAGLPISVTLFVLAACGGEEEVSPEPTPSPQSTPIAPMDGSSVTFEAVEMGQRSGVAGSGPQVLRVETEGEWMEFWSQHQASVIPAPELPPVDFSREMVVAVVDQDEPSGGYGFEISAIVVNEGRLDVLVTREAPGPDCVVTAEITRPFHIVRTAKSDLQPQIVISDETYRCDY